MSFLLKNLKNPIIPKKCIKKRIIKTTNWKFDFKLKFNKTPNPSVNTDSLKPSKIIKWDINTAGNVKTYEVMLTSKEKKLLIFSNQLRHGSVRIY